MSIWGKIAGIGVAALGVATGNPALIGTGASIFGADVASEGAKSAAKTQDAAADKSLALQKNIYERGQAGLSPYMSAGAGAVTNLRGLTGQPLEVVGPAAGTPSTMPANAAVPSTRTASDAGAVPTGDVAVPRTTLQNFATSQTQSGYVTMRSPDGSMTQAVPANLVEHYRQQGASVVS